MSVCCVNVFALYAFLFGQKPHVQAEQVFFGDHRRDVLLKFIHGERFHIADAILGLINYDEAPWAEAVHFLCQSPILEIRLLTILSDIMISLHYASLEGIMALGVNCPVLQPWDQKPNTILACSVYTLHISTVLGLVSLENGTTKIDYL